VGHSAAAGGLWQRQRDSALLSLGERDVETKKPRQLHAESAGSIGETHAIPGCPVLPSYAALGRASRSTSRSSRCGSAVGAPVPALAFDGPARRRERVKGRSPCDPTTGGCISVVQPALDGASLAQQHEGTCFSLAPVTPLGQGKEFSKTTQYAVERGPHRIRRIIPTTSAACSTIESHTTHLPRNSPGRPKAPMAPVVRPSSAVTVTLSTPPGTTH
jgi:hypothetical protein